MPFYNQQTMSDMLHSEQGMSNLRAIWRRFWAADGQSLPDFTLLLHNIPVDPSWVKREDKDIQGLFAAQKHGRLNDYIYGLFRRNFLSEFYSEKTGDHYHMPEDGIVKWVLRDFLMQDSQQFLGDPALYEACEQKFNQQFIQVFMNHYLQHLRPVLFQMDPTGVQAKEIMYRLENLAYEITPRRLQQSFDSRENFNVYVYQLAVTITYYINALKSFLYRNKATEQPIFSDKSLTDALQELEKLDTKVKQLQEKQKPDFKASVRYEQRLKKILAPFESELDKYETPAFELLKRQYAQLHVDEILEILNRSEEPSLQFSKEKLNEFQQRYQYLLQQETLHREMTYDEVQAFIADFDSALDEAARNCLQQHRTREICRYFATNEDVVGELYLPSSYDEGRGELRLDRAFNAYRSFAPVDNRAEVIKHIAEVYHDETALRNYIYQVYFENCIKKYYKQVGDKYYLNPEITDAIFSQQPKFSGRQPDQKKLVAQLNENFVVAFSGWLSQDLSIDINKTLKARTIYNHILTMMRVGYTSAQQKVDRGVSLTSILQKYYVSQADFADFVRRVNQAQILVTTFLTKPTARLDDEQRKFLRIDFVNFLSALKSSSPQLFVQAFTHYPMQRMEQNLAMLEKNIAVMEGDYQEALQPLAKQLREIFPKPKAVESKTEKELFEHYVDEVRNVTSPAFSPEGLGMRIHRGTL